jgi:multidrug resistance protein, MATE family
MWKEIKLTLKLGWPIILGNLTQMSLGIIDSAMVGSIHSSQLAAASFVNNLIALPMVFNLGFTMAISPLVAVAQGEGDYDKPLRITYNGLWVAGMIAILFGILIHLNSGIVFRLGQDEIVANLSENYLIWMVWSILPMSLFSILKQFSDGLGFTKWPLYIALSAMPINVLLNYGLIFGKWGIPALELEGAGIGTLLSRLYTLVVISILIFKHKQFGPYRQHLATQLIIKTERIKDVIRLGIPAAMQYGMEAGAFAVSGIMVGWLGYQQQAAHQIALNIAAMTFMVSLGISATGSIRVGYAYGKKDFGKVLEIGKTILWLSAAYGVLCAVFYILFRFQLPLFFNKEPEVVAYATVLLFLAGVFQISDSVQAVAVGLLRGIQDVKIPTILVAIAYWIIGIPLGYYLAFNVNMEVNGLWIGLVVGLSMSAIFLTKRFLNLSLKNRTLP